MSFQIELDQTYLRLRKFISTSRRDLDWRIKQLLSLKKLIEDNDSLISEALWKDLHKGHFECQTTEQGVVLSEINFALDNITQWMEDESVSTPIYNQPGHCVIMREPYGLTLIIGAWNYPINLLLSPLVAAIAGGNGAILKPSEISAHTSKVIATLVPQYLDSDAFAVFEGGVEKTDMILDKAFDLIFFTGSSPVGKIILAKAAPHLTPVVLELGGKSPAIVLSDADLEITARRIAWGKFMNAGQTCIAPDYILIEANLKEEFVKELKKQLENFYGKTPETSPDYCRIINLKNFKRLTNYLNGLQILHGGNFLEDELFIAPTIVQATAESKIMQEEIFGPILPLIEIENIEEAITFINSRPKPLALYLYTKDKNASDKVCLQTSSGAICINDNVIQMPMTSAPFGGVGASGMGNYHGYFGFKTFTHAKTILHKTFHLDVSVRYPPYNSRNEKILGWLTK